MTERKSSEDLVPHTLVVIVDGGERLFEISHLPDCATEIVDGDISTTGGSFSFERFRCRVGDVVEYAGLDFLEHEDGTQGWLSLEPGTYHIVSYVEYISGEFGGTYGEEWDYGVRLREVAPDHEVV